MTRFIGRRLLQGIVLLCIVATIVFFLGRLTGNPVDLIALLCYHYNPTTGKYGLAVLSIMRLVGIATVLGLVFGIALARRREGGPRTATAGTLLEGDR